MNRMRPHEEGEPLARAIVFSCGFYFHPFALGVLTVAEKAREKFGRPGAAGQSPLRNVKAACLAQLGDRSGDVPPPGATLP